MATTTGDCKRDWTRYSRGEWAATAAPGELPVHAVLPRDEMTEIMWPLSQRLRREVAGPSVFGVTGSVTAGKSTFSSALRDLVAEWPSPVSVLTTDNFLHPNRVLAERGIMHRKGFPESYDLAKLTEVMHRFRDGDSEIETPVYSHERYDIVEGETQALRGGGVLILEGVLVGSLHGEVDTLIYLDAEESDLENWFRRRTSKLRQAAQERPDLFFHQFRDMSEEELAERATKIWRDINLLNLREHIVPYRDCADVILRKDSQHRTTEVLVATK